MWRTRQCGGFSSVEPEPRYGCLAPASVRACVAISVAVVEDLFDARVARFFDRSGSGERGVRLSARPLGADTYGRRVRAREGE